MGKIKRGQTVKERKGLLVILSNGAFFRPIDTPCGQAGWIGEITFFSDPRIPRIKKIPNISARFDTQPEAEMFVRQEMYKLIHKTTFTVRSYNNEQKFNSTPIC